MAKVINNCVGGTSGGKYEESFEFSFCDNDKEKYIAEETGLVSVEHEFDLEDEEVAIAGSFRKGKKFIAGTETFTFAMKDSATLSKLRAAALDRYLKLAQGNANAYGQHINGGLNVSRKRTYPNGAKENAIYNNLSYNPKNLQGLGENNTVEWEIEAVVPVQGFIVEQIGSGKELPKTLVDMYEYSIDSSKVQVVGGTVDLSKVVITSTQVEGESLFVSYDVVKYKIDGNKELVAVGEPDLSAQTAVPLATGETVVVMGNMAPGTAFQVLIIEG
jgi:hypothetical protein